MNRHERRQAKKLRIAGGGKSRLGGSDDLKRLALSHLQSGRWADAETLYKRALTIEPSDPDVLHFLGIIAYRTGRYDLAITRLTEATRLAPGYAEAHNNLGILLLEQRKVDQAIPGSSAPSALSRITRPRMRTGAMPCGRADGSGEAIALYRRAIQLNPNHKEAHYWLAAAMLSQGNLAAVADVCGKCLRLDPLCQHALAYQSIAQYGLNKKTTRNI